MIVSSNTYCSEAAISIARWESLSCLERLDRRRKSGQLRPHQLDETVVVGLEAALVEILAIVLPVLDRHRQGLAVRGKPHRRARFEQPVAQSQFLGEQGIGVADHQPWAIERVQLRSHAVPEQRTGLRPVRARVHAEARRALEIARVERRSAVRQMMLDEDRGLLLSADGRAEIERHRARRVIPQILPNLFAVQLDDLDVIVRARSCRS